MTARDWELIAAGAVSTIQMFGIALSVGLVGGASFALVRCAVVVGRIRWCWPLLDTVAAVSRGVPMLVQILVAVYAPGLVGIRPDPLLGSLAALIFFATSSIGEIGRGSIDSIPSGQWLAAQSTGMTWIQAMRHVIAPQALRIAIPPLIGFTAQLMKATSIASIVGTTELTRAGSIIATRSSQPLTAFLMIGLVYLVLTVPLIGIGRIAERRVAFEA